MIDLEMVKSDFRLKSFSVKEFSINTGEVEKGASGEIKIGIDYDLSSIENEDSNIGALEICVTAKVEDDNGIIFDIHLKVLGIFEAEKEKMEEDVFSQFLEYQGIALLIPFIRSFLRSATSEWGIGPALILPTININDLVEFHNNKEKPTSD